MARPVNANAEVTRARIVDAARTLFAERGPEAVGLREVAAEARVGLATVTHYYRSKAELEAAVVDLVVERLATLRVTLMPLLVNVTDLRTAMSLIIPETHRFVRKHLTDIRMMMRLTLHEGTVPAKTMEDSLLPLLDQAGPLLAGISGVSEQRARLTVLSLNHLVIRYGLTPLAELTRVVGLPKGRSSQGAAVAAVDAYLVDMCLAMMETPRTQPVAVAE